MIDAPGGDRKAFYCFCYVCGSNWYGQPECLTCRDNGEPPGIDTVQANEFPTVRTQFGAGISIDHTRDVGAQIIASEGYLPKETADRLKTKWAEAFYSCRAPVLEAGMKFVPFRPFGDLDPDAANRNA